MQDDGLVSHTTWLPPNLVRIETEWPDGAKLWLMLYVVPNVPGRCINIGRQVFKKGKTGKWPPGVSVVYLGRPIGDLEHHEYR